MLIRCWRRLSKRMSATRCATLALLALVLTSRHRDESFVARSIRTDAKERLTKLNRLPVLD
jgi:hypothetical protein